QLEELDCSDNLMLEELKLSPLIPNNLRLNITDNPNLKEIKNKPKDATNIDTEYLYFNFQEWLDEEYPNKEKAEVIEIKSIGFIDESELEIKDFPNLKEIKKDRENVSQVTKVTISNCPELKEIDFSSNKLVEINLTNNKNLTNLSCSDNLLNNLDLSQNLNLEYLDIMDNNFEKQDLSFLSNLVNLKTLLVGNSSVTSLYLKKGEVIKEKIQKGLPHNRFYGSLEFLQGLSKLEYLGISYTDIDKGLEFLPNSLETCNVGSIPETKVIKLDEELFLYRSNLKV
ncbi:9472_t:CDS:1, partial [Ambispora gerdemannii]